MSRIDIQSDRLLRGGEGFERQRTFLVQPERFASTQSNAASALISVLGQTAGVVADVRAKERQVQAKAKAEQQTAALGELIEARNLANANPEQFGTAYTKMFRDVVSSTDPSDPFRNQVLKLDADSFVSNRLEAQRGLAEDRITGFMKVAFEDVGKTYNLESEQAPEYISLNPAERKARIHSEYLESFPTEVQDAILENDNLKVLLSRQASAISSIYDADYSEMIGRQESEERRKTLTGISERTLQDRSLSDVSVESYSKAYGLTPTQGRSEVYQHILSQSINDIQLGSLTSSESTDLLKFLEAEAEKIGPEATSEYVKVRNAFTSTVTTNSRVDAQTLLNQGFEENRPLDEIEDSINTILLSQLSEVTGETYDPEVDNILSLDVDTIGLDQDVVRNLRQVMSENLSTINRVRDARDKAVKPLTDYESAVGSLGLNLINTSLSSIQIEGASIEESLLTRGRQDYRNVQQFQNIPDRNNRFHDAFVESADDSPTRMYIVGTMLSLPTEQYIASLSGMDEAEAAGMIAVQKAVVSVRPEELTPEFLTGLTQEYNKGVSMYSQYSNPPGSSSADYGLSADALKASKKSLGFSADHSFSTRASKEIALLSTRLPASADISQEERQELLLTAVQNSSLTFYFDSATNAIEVLNDPARVHPSSAGFSNEDVQNDITFKKSFVRRILDPVLNTTDMTVNLLKNTTPYGRYIPNMDTGPILETTVDRSVFDTSPVIGDVLAQRFDIDVSNAKNSMHRVAASLTADALKDKYSDLDVQAYEELFSRSFNTEGFLDLGFTTRGGDVYLTASGLINGEPLGGESQIELIKWEPEFNQSIGKTRSGVLLSVGLDAGIRGVKDVTREALEASSKAREANPEAFNIRP